MSQAPLRLTSDTPLPGLPRGPLSPEQQLEALRRVQAQAEQRVKLGIQLFKAAESHTAQQQQLADDVKTEQKKLHEELQRDVAASLHTYDQWISKIDQDFTASVRGLEQKITTLQDQWDKTQKRIEGMMKRSEAMLDQSRYLLESAGRKASGKPLAPMTSPPASERPVESATMTSPLHPAVTHVPTVPAAVRESSTQTPVSDHPPAFLSEDQIVPHSPTIYTEIIERLRNRPDDPPHAA